MRKMSLVLIAGVAMAAALATVFGVWHEGNSAGADPFLVVGIDMDSAGNSCPGTGTEDCTLGTIDQCVSVPNAEGATFTVDTFIQGLTNGFQAWNHNLHFPDTATSGPLTMTTETLTDPTVNLSVQSPGSEAVPASEGVPDPPGTPSNDGLHTVGVAELGTSETTPPFTQGVLGRFTFSVGAGATSGVYDLTLEPPPLSAYLDKDSIAYAVDATVEGKVALGQDCPPSPPLPTATPGASPTPSTSVTPTPTGTPLPGTVSLVIGWNDACYQGQAQAIGDAFAAVMGNLHAAYRMNPDQTFDRWFPTRPELSTITTLNPFDQLLILASSNTTWTVQSPALLPSSTPLSTGWNSVCYLGGGKDTATAATGISGGFSIIYSLPPDQVWHRYVPGRPEVSDLARLETFTSVLILMTDPAGGTWAFSP